MLPHDDSMDQILKAALQFNDRQERERWLIHKCGNNQEKLNELLSLIHDSDNISDNNKTVIMDTASEATRNAPELLQTLEGIQIGPFELIRQIGKGGMGAVYLALQSHPMTRLVAIKLIQQNRETRHILERFQIEQQTLADMDHPNIARIIDAGATEAGFHYIAMEYVQGEQLLDYCQKNRPSLRVKINLMLQCCRAIQHAHQKGTIHRDIKPSNVMVTMVDGEPFVKIIDFGIAKALLRDTESTYPTNSNPWNQITQSATQTGILTGTPLFMSPEQYFSHNQRVDTRSDIYSLGALFYTLLTGKPPFDAAAVRDKSIGEIRELVLKTLPLSPSQRDPKNAHLLRGDLDAIVLKAMQRNPEDRYQSVDQLHDDLRCYLSEYPISATRASTWTNLKKFSRRNKRLIAVATLGIAGLFIGLVLAIAKERRAVELERIARQQSFASDMLLSSMAINQGNYSLAKSILERSADPVRSRWDAHDISPVSRLDWRLLTAKLPVSPETLASFPTRIYFALPLAERNEIACGCKDSHLRILNCENGKIRLDIDTQQREINGLALSPDRQLIASGGDDGTVKLWNTETGEPAGYFQASSKSVFQLGWSADGKYLVTAGIQPDAVVWSLPEFQIVRQFDSSNESLECLDVSKQGNIVYGSSKGIVRVATLNDVQSSEIQDISLSTSRAFSVNRCSTVVVSPSGRMLATGLDNGYLILLQKIGNDYHAVERIRFKTTVTAIAFDRDETRIAIGEDSGAVHILNLLGKWPTQSRLSFTKYFIDTNAKTLGDSGSPPADLWNLVTRSEPPAAKETLPLDCDRVYLEFEKPLLDPLFADNYLLEWMDETGQVNPAWTEIPTEVNVKGDGIEIKFENHFGGWQIANDLQFRGRLQSWSNHSKRVASILWSKDDARIYSVSEDGKINSLRVNFIEKNFSSQTKPEPLVGEVMRWNKTISGPSKYGPLSEHPGTVTTLVTHQSGNLFFSGKEQHGNSEVPWSLYRWNTATNTREKLLDFPDNIQPQFIIGVIDENRFILFYRDLLDPQPTLEKRFPIGCWDKKLGKMLWRIPAPKEPIRNEKFSPQHRFLSFTKEREVILVNPLTGEPSSLGHFSDTPITATSFSTDDRFLAVATSDRRIVCFHTDNGQEAWNIVLPGSPALDIFWSKDLCTLACVSRDGFLRTFDVHLRQMTAEIRLSLSDPVNIQSSPDEDILYVLGLNGTILRVPCNTIPTSRR